MDENQSNVPDFLGEIAQACDGKLTGGGLLPDGSGFAIMSMPLPKTHWIYQGDRVESYGVFNVPPMPFRMGWNEKAMVQIAGTNSEVITKEEFCNKIRECGRYAVRCATMNGKEMDFDPDALVQNLITGMLGYHTETGLSDDKWANPKGD